MNRRIPMAGPFTVRGSLAALFIVLFAATTSWTSACDLSCSLRQFHSICQIQGAAPSINQQAASSSSDMAMDPNMAMPADHTDAENGPVGLHDKSCDHSPCNETSVSAISKPDTHHPARDWQLIVSASPSVVATALQVDRSIPEQGSPKLQPFDPLSVNLRI